MMRVIFHKKKAKANTVTNALVASSDRPGSDGKYKEKANDERLKNDGGTNVAAIRNRNRDEGIFAPNTRSSRIIGPAPNAASPRLAITSVS